jgi:hypothetical protein
MRGTANFLASLRVFKIHFLQPVLISELVDNGDVGPEGLAFPALGRDHPKSKLSSATQRLSIRLLSAPGTCAKPDVFGLRILAEVTRAPYLLMGDGDHRHGDDPGRTGA